MTTSHEFPIKISGLLSYLILKSTAALLAKFFRLVAPSFLAGDAATLAFLVILSVLIKLFLFMIVSPRNLGLGPYRWNEKFGIGLLSYPLCACGAITFSSTLAQSWACNNAQRVTL